MPQQAKKKNPKRIKKENYWQRLWGYCDDYQTALLVDVDNVSSKQIIKLRQKLRAINAHFVCGKNTLMKAALNYKMGEPTEGQEDYETRKDSWKPMPELEKLVNALRGNTGIIFSNGDLTEVKKVIDAEAREAPAKAGAIAPDDVWIQPGATGLDPKQTSFFQNLQIATKIVKTQIDIIAEKKILTSGQKIEPTHAALLDKLKIRPFSYKMHVKAIYDKGQIISAAILDITNDDILAKLSTGISNMASISLASGYVTKPAIPHLILNSFKNLASVTFATDYSFPQADKMKAAAAAGAVAAAPAGGAPAKAEKAEEKEEEEEEANVDMGGLFGDDY